VITRN